MPVTQALTSFVEEFLVYLESEGVPLPSSEGLESLVGNVQVYLESQGVTLSSSQESSSSQQAASSQQIAITVAKKVIDSLILSNETNRAKFNELFAVVVRSQAEAQVAQNIFNKFVFDSSISTILKSVSSGLDFPRILAALK